MEAIRYSNRLVLKVYAFNNIYYPHIEKLYYDSKLVDNREVIMKLITPIINRICDWMEGDYIDVVKRSLNNSYQESRAYFEEDKEKVLKILKRLRLNIKENQSLYSIDGIRNEIQYVRAFHIELVYSIERIQSLIEKFVPKRISVESEKQTININTNIKMKLINEWTFQEFLGIISGYNIIKTYSLSINLDDTIKGTLDELKSFSIELDNINFSQLINTIDTIANIEYSNIEIHNYIDNLTNNFDVEKCKIVLNEMEVFESMELHEELDVLAHKMYDKHNWDIPFQQVDIKGVLEKRKDYDEMRNKAYPLLTYTFDELKYTLKTRLMKSNENKDIMDLKNGEKIDVLNNEVEIGLDVNRKIEKHLGFLLDNCPRQNRQILSKEDYENIIEWMKYYYNNSFILPEIKTPIRNVNTNKTIIQLALKFLFKELHPSNTYPRSLFDFYITAFSKYSKDKRTNFGKVSQSNGIEVKKLMKLI